jgi:hypothetical protein
MESSNFAKIAAAFASGIVVALGSALLYVRASNIQHRATLVRPAAAGQGAPLAQQPPADPQQTAAAIPDETAPDVEQAPAPVRRRKHLRKPVTHTSPAPALVEASKPNEVAQNPYPAIAPPQPNPTPAQATPRAINEDQYQGPQPTPEAQANPAPAPPPRPHVVTLAAGTSVFIRLGETLSTEHNYTGDTFRATLEQPIVMDGFVIADRGSKVLGQIVNAERAGRVRGVSDLNLNLTEINTTDGQQVRITTDAFEKHGPSSTREDTAKIAGGAALGAIIGALGGGGKGAAIGAGAGGAAGTAAVLATRGKAAIIPTETRMQFRLTNPVTITEKFN